MFFKHTLRFAGTQLSLLTDTALKKYSPRLQPNNTQCLLCGSQRSERTAEGIAFRQTILNLEIHHGHYQPLGQKESPVVKYSIPDFFSFSDFFPREKIQANL